MESEKKEKGVGSLQKIGEILQVGAEEKELREKAEVKDILHFYLLQEKATLKSMNGKHATILLKFLAERSQIAEEGIRNLTEISQDQLCSFFKIPLAVHLSNSSIMTQLELLEEFFLKANSATVSEEVEESLEKIQSVISTLKTHLFCLGKCNMALKECIGEANYITFERICSNFIAPMTKVKHLEATKAKEISLRQSLKTQCETFLLVCHAENSAISAKDFPTSLSMCISSHTTPLDLPSLVSWISSPQVTKLITTKLMEHDSGVLDLFSAFFLLEAEYCKEQLTNFLLQKKTLEIPFKQTIKELYEPFSKLFNEAFLFIG